MAKGPDAAPRHRRALHRRLSPRPPGRRCPPGSVPVGPVPLRAGGWVAMAASPEERGGWRRRAELSSPCLRGARVGRGPGRCCGSGGPFEAGRAIERQQDPGGRQRGGGHDPFLCPAPGAPRARAGVRPHTGSVPPAAPAGSRGGRWGRTGLRGAGAKGVRAGGSGVPTPGAPRSCDSWGAHAGGSSGKQRLRGAGEPLPGQRGAGAGAGAGLAAPWERRRGKAPTGPGRRKPPARGSQWPEGGGGTPGPGPAPAPATLPLPGSAAASPSRPAPPAPRYERPAGSGEPRTCPGPGVGAVRGVRGCRCRWARAGGRGRAGAGPGRGRGAD
ncbi:uncharacterized protein GJ701_015110 [Geothlypis trichas]